MMLYFTFCKQFCLHFCKILDFGITKYYLCRINKQVMKKTYSFKAEPEIVERAHALAVAENRSLSNYIETMLMGAGRTGMANEILIDDQILRAIDRYLRQTYQDISELSIDEFNNEDHGGKPINNIGDFFEYVKEVCNMGIRHFEHYNKYHAAEI